MVKKPLKKNKIDDDKDLHIDVDDIALTEDIDALDPEILKEEPLEADLELPEDLADPIEAEKTETTTKAKTTTDESEAPAAQPIILKCQKCGEEVVEEAICPVCGTPMKIVSGPHMKDEESDDDPYSIDDEPAESPELKYAENDLYDGLNTYDEDRMLTEDPYE